MQRFMIVVTVAEVSPTGVIGRSGMEVRHLTATNHPPTGGFLMPLVEESRLGTAAAYERLTGAKHRCSKSSEHERLLERKQLAEESFDLGFKEGRRVEREKKEPGGSIISPKVDKEDQSAQG